jgi:hypothetical protein
MEKLFNKKHVELSWMEDEDTGILYVWDYIQEIHMDKIWPHIYFGSSLLNMENTCSQKPSRKHK